MRNDLLEKCRGQFKRTKEEGEDKKFKRGDGLKCRKRRRRKKKDEERTTRSDIRAKGEKQKMGR